ncbi:MAG TPA: hypothetical protein VFK16_01235 [Gemmatimonadaceae bacterium]|nr:hypothetical protein [Gemmatimonadaceae bacterium]
MRTSKFNSGRRMPTRIPARRDRRLRPLDTRRARAARTTGGRM